MTYCFNSKRILIKHMKVAEFAFGIKIVTAFFMDKLKVKIKYCNWDEDLLTYIIQLIAPC